MSKLWFRFGSMNSGKSTALIQVAYNYEERGQRVLIVKPSVDTKSEYVLSRLGARRKVDISAASQVNLYDEILAKHQEEPVHCVIVDEVQFLEPAQVDQLFTIAVTKNIPVIGYGIRTDFQTKFFPGSARMMELAHSIEEMKTICRCGRKATFNARKVNETFVKDGNQVAIDGQNVEYEALCGACYIRIIGLS